MQLCSSLNILWHCLSLGFEWKLTFSSPVGTAEFSKFADIVSAFTASSFRIWNSSTGIPSSPPALFLVMLPKAHLTSHSRMSGSRWVTTPTWLFGSLRPFLYSSSVWTSYSCHLFLISYAIVRILLFLSFITPILAWNVPLISNFLEEIASLFHSIVFSLFLCIV